MGYEALVKRQNGWWCSRSAERSWHPNYPRLSLARTLHALRKSACVGKLAILGFALMMVPVTGLADTDEVVSPNQVQSGSLLLRMKSGYHIATRMNSDVHITVSGLAARTTLRQTFRNDSMDWVEGVYVFPLPDGSAVDHLRMTIGDRVIEGEIREKQAAKKAYEQAKRAGKKASLVEQQRANLFTSNVANIGPGQEVTIEIAYLDTVRYDEGTFRLRFPMTLTPRFIPGVAVNDRQGSGWSADTDRVPDASLITPPVVEKSTEHRITLRADINAGMPLKFVASRYHPVKVEENNGKFEIRFSGGPVAMDHDFELIWRPEKVAAPTALVFSEDVDNQPHLLIMLMPPNDDAVSARVMPRDLVFVIDTSGSMHGSSIEQAKKALHLALDGLRPSDRFNVVQFNSVTDALFSTSVPASLSNVSIARDYVDSLVANGGTEMRRALELALAARPSETHLRQVIFVTDGSVGNEDELFNVIERKLGNARLFTVGIGSAPNGWFMRKAAEAGRGTYVFISASHEVNEKMGRLFRKLEQPQVTDIVVQWPDSVEEVALPATVPDLYAGEPVVLKARLGRAARAGDQLKISGRSAGGDWGAELPLSGNESSPGIAALWARARIADLLDSERRGKATGEIRGTIIDLALRHHLVSKYTSLVAVDKTPSRPADAALKKEQIPNLLPHGQSQRAIFGFPATATSAAQHRRNGALFILLATLFLLYRVWTLKGFKNDDAAAS
jgi:Ca-activated chloride channel family protein